MGGFVFSAVTFLPTARHLPLPPWSSEAQLTPVNIYQRVIQALLPHRRSGRESVMLVYDSLQLPEDQLEPYYFWYTALTMDYRFRFYSHGYRKDHNILPYEGDALAGGEVLYHLNEVSFPVPKDVRFLVIASPDAGQPTLHAAGVTLSVITQLTLPQQSFQIFRRQADQRVGPRTDVTITLFKVKQVR